MAKQSFAVVHVHRHTDAYADTPSHGDNMLGLCDPSNLLLVLSAEERRYLLKLLRGGLVNVKHAPGRLNVAMV